MKFLQASVLLLACLYSQANGQSRSPMDLRLVTGDVSPPPSFTGGSSGRLEIYIDGRWGTVCDRYNSFSSNEANVVCRQLGYSFALSYRTVSSSTSNRLPVESSVPILLSGVDCDGSESRLYQCRHEAAFFNCFHFDDVEVTCATTDGDTINDSDPFRQRLSPDTIIAIAVGVSVGAVVLIVIVGVICCIVCCVCCRARSRARNVRAEAAAANVYDTRHVQNSAYESHELQTGAPHSHSEGPSQPATSTIYNERHVENTAYEPHNITEPPAEPATSHVYDTSTHVQPATSTVYNERHVENIAYEPHNVTEPPAEPATSHVYDTATHVQPSTSTVYDTTTHVQPPMSNTEQPQNSAELLTYSTAYPPQGVSNA